MDNVAAQYETLIRQFCEAAGIADWTEVVESQHIQIGERLVGLILNPDDDEPVLTLCIGLDQTYDQTDSELYARLLEANFEAGNRTRGYYGLHPESKQALYIVRLGLQEMNGEELANFLQTQLEQSAWMLEQIRQAA